MSDSTEIRDINIPANALTTCPDPDRRYALVGIERVCSTCPNFLGLFDVMEQEAAFPVKYRVKCGVPQAREITMAHLGGD